MPGTPSIDAVAAKYRAKKLPASISGHPVLAESDFQMPATPPSFGKLREIESKMPAPPAIKPVSVGKPQEDRTKVANLLRTVASFGEGTLAGGAVKGVGKIGALAGGMAGALVGLAPKGSLGEARQKQLGYKPVKEEHKGPIAKTLTEKPLPQTFEETYRKKFYEPLIKKTPSPKAFEIGHEFGEWAAPTALTSLIGGPVAGAIGTATKGIPVVRTVAPVVARAAVEAPIAKTIVEAGKPKEERTSLPETMPYWAGGELAGKAVGAAGKALASRLRNAVASRSMDVLKVEPPKVETKGYVPPKRLDIEPEVAEVKVTEAPTKGAEKVEDLVSKLKPDVPLIEERDYKYVGSKNVKAYSWEHPELKPHIQAEATRLLTELEYTVPGERVFIRKPESYDYEVQGVPRFTSEPIARAKDELKVSYEQIRDALQRIVNDKGQENAALAKKLELIIDDNLTHGTRSIEGYDIPPNDEYIKAKKNIEAKLLAEKLKSLYDQLSPEKQVEVRMAAETGDEETQLRILLGQEKTTGKKAEFFGDVGTVGAAKLNIPEKGSVIEGTTEKVRSFPISVAKSPKTKDELTKRLDIEPETAKGAVSKEAKVSAGETKPLPPLTDNSIKPLSTYTNKLYREASIENAGRYIPGFASVDTTYDEPFFANTLDLALGQGKNKGVLLEFDSKKIQGQVNTAIPSWELIWKQGQAEFIGRLNDQKTYQDALQSITIRPGAKASPVILERFKRVLAKLQEQGWIKEENPDGSITYRRPKTVTAKTAGKKAEFFGDVGTVGAAKLNIPEKGSVIEGTTEKVRSFPVSVAKSPKTKDELKFGVLAEIYEGGRGAYQPVKLKDVYEQAGEIVDKTPDAAVNMIYGQDKPSALQTAVGIRLIEKYQNEGDFDKAIDAALTLSEKLTRNGQAIAAARLINWATPEGAIITAQRQIRNAVKQLTKTGRMSEQEAKALLENPASEEAQAVAQKYGLPTLTPDIAEKIKGLTDVLQNAGDEATRWEAMAELKAFLQTLKPSSLLRKISAVQIIAQLLNPKTQVRNILGNELFYRIERINKFVATPIDWARTKITGKPRQVTFSTGGQGGFWEGFLKGWSAGWKGVSPRGLETQFDIGKGLAFNPQGNPAERVMSFLERALWATMHGFDYAAYNRAYKQTLGELAVLRAMNEGKEVTKELIEQYMREADANLVNIAEQYGKHATFQDDNLISKTFAGAKQLLNLHKEFGLGDLVIKYPRTPGALLARGLEYSPAGFLRSAYQIAMAVWRSLRGEAVKSDERELLLGLSRAITGTIGLTGLGYFLYDSGTITGPTETDSDVAAMQRQLGTHPYRVNVTALKRWVMSGFNPDAAKPQQGDLYVSYDWAQPVAMAIAMGANTAKEAEDARLKSLKEKITNITTTDLPRLLTEGISAGVETLAEQPLFSGVSQLFTKYGNEPPGQTLIRNLTYLAEGAPASFVPTLLSQLRALANNTARITWSKSPIQEMINRVKYKIPGLASTLPPAYTTLGQPKETYPGGGNTLFNVFLNPAYVNRYRPTKEQLMPLEVWKETGETTQFPRAVDRYFMIGGKRIDLTPEEMSEYQRILGTLTQRGFSMIPPEMAAQDKKKVMDKIIEQANLAAKVLILARRVAKKKGNSQ